MKMYSNPNIELIVLATSDVITGSTTLQTHSDDPYGFVGGSWRSVIDNFEIG